MVFAGFNLLKLADLDVTSSIVLVSATQELNVFTVVVLVAGVVLAEVTIKSYRVTHLLSVTV